MNKKAFILFAAVLLALLFSCSGDTIQSSEQLPVETTAKLHMTAQDAITGNALESVSVTLQRTGETKSTSENGTAVFEGVQAGVHKYTANKDGYASVRKEVQVGDNKDGGVFIATDGFSDIQLYPLTAGLEGYLYYTDSTGKSVPMPEVSVRIEINDGYQGFITQTYEVKTNDSGRYIFSKLPPMSSYYYKLYVLDKTIGSITYTPCELTGNANLVHNVVSKNPKKDYNSYVGNIFILTEYPRMPLTNEQTDAALLFKFSEKIDMSSVKSNTVVVKQNSVEVATKIEWGESSITITPVGKWTKNIEVEINNLKSISGKSLTTTKTITLLKADLSGKKVTGLIVPDSLKDGYLTYIRTRIDFRWNKLEGAEGYQVFVREEDSDSYREITTWCYNFREFKEYVNATDFKEYVTADCPFAYNSAVANNGNAIKNKTNTFVVRAFNEQFQSTIIGADSVKVFNRAPTDLIKAGGYYIYDDCISYNTLKDCNAGWESVQPHIGSDTSFYFYDFNPDPAYDPKTTINPYAFGAKYDLGEKLKQSDAVVVSYGRLFFNRAMDMGVKPTVSCKDETGAAVTNACSKLDLELAWSNGGNPTRDMNLILTLKTKDGNVPTGYGSVNVLFTIAGLKGKNGKEFTTKYGDKERNVVNIRFATTIPNPCDSEPFGLGCPCATNTAPSYLFTADQCCAIETNYNNNSVCHSNSDPLNDPCALFPGNTTACSNWCKTSTNASDSRCNAFCSASEGYNWDTYPECRTGSRNPCLMFGNGGRCNDWCRLSTNAEIAPSCNDFCKNQVTDWETYTSCRTGRNGCDYFPGITVECNMWCETPTNATDDLCDEFCSISSNWDTYSDCRTRNACRTVGYLSSQCIDWCSTPSTSNASDPVCDSYCTTASIADYNDNCSARDDYCLLFDDQPGCPGYCIQNPTETGTNSHDGFLNEDNYYTDSGSNAYDCSGK
jgi:hypothetical protein